MALQISISNAIGARAVAGGGGIDPDAQAFITAASITDPTQQSAINTLVTDLKGYNIWTKFSALYPMVGGTNSKHSWNLKNTAQYQISWQGGVTSSANGIQFNGTNSYGITGYNPSVNGSLNSHHFSFYSRTNSNGVEVEAGLSDATGRTNLLEIRTSGTTYVAVNSGNTYTTFSDTDSRAFYLANRTASNVVNAWRNSTKVATGTTASTSLPNGNHWLGAWNNIVNPALLYYSTKQCAFASIGDGLTDTEATNFYTAVQTFQTTLGRQVGTPIPYTSFPLDTYSGAEAAYSLRRLRTAYTGSLIRVRRSSDNTEQNIGFVNNVLDTASLLTFCGAGDGFVTTWYDQSGNAKNATQTTAINQPRIVNAGVVELKNGLPNLNFTTQFLLIGTQVNLTGNHYLTFVGNSSANATSPAGFITYQANDDPELRIGAGTDGNGVLSYYNGGYRVNATTQGTTYSIFTHQMTGSFTSTFFRNSTQIATGSAAGALSNVQFFTIGAYSNSTNTRNGDCQEFIVWANDQSTNRTGITNNINTFYTIY